MKKLSYNLVVMLSISTVFAGSVMLSACTNPKKTLGLNRSAPDEFTVIAKAPLILPPDYNLTPATENIAVSPDIKTPQEKAKSSIFPLDESKARNNVDVKDKGTNALLAMAGASEDNQDIRSLIDKETLGLIEDNKGLADMLIFWNEEPYDPTAVTVNALKERERIEANKEANLPVTDGETPTIKAKPKLGG